MRRYKLVLFVLVSMLAFGATTGCATWYGPYYGQVVEKGTGAPIEGAAVLALAYTVSSGPAGNIYRFGDAYETLTDKGGNFSIPRFKVKAEDMGFFSGWDKYPRFRVFKPGYGCYPNHKEVTPMFVPNGSLPEKQFVTIELPSLKTRKERIESTHCSVSLDVPYPKAKEYMELINIERKSLGLGEVQYK